MLSQRWRPVVYSVAGIFVIWVVATAGYLIAKNSKMTAEKVKAYADSVDLSKLSPDARARAIQELAKRINALSADERRRTRLDRTSNRWFEQMTEEEKGEFLEATMPTGFKQMLTASEQPPEDKRRKSVDDALRRLREAQTKFGSGTNQPSGTNALSAELQAKVRTIGLKTFYSQSSAQTKAEMAPVLEELQKVMESGRPFRGR